MSGSGMVVESGSRPVKQVKTTIIGSSPTRMCRMNELLFPFYRKSFRSGSAYTAEKGKYISRAVFHDQTLIENLLHGSGMDIGHEYAKQEVTKMVSSFHRVSGPSTSFVDNSALPRTFVVPSGTGLNDVSSIMDYTSFSSGGVSDATLVAEGTRLINVTNPLKPPVDLAVSLSEFLREGLPSGLGKALIGSAPNKRDLIRSLGSDYLNYMFGISPIIRDIASLVDLLQGSYDMITTWQRNDGRKIRRRRAWDLPSTRTSFNKTLSGDASISIILPVSLSNKTAVGLNKGTTADWTGQIESNMDSSTSYSFSSSFEYKLSALIPEYPEPIRTLLLGNYSNKQIVEALLLMRQYGLDPSSVQSANTYWNLLPFSWLLDWFVNIGDLMSSVTAFQQQGLLLDYGYMTSYQVNRFSADYWFKIGTSTYSGVCYLEGIKHRRIRATPYGFGTTFTGLNTVQLSLLAALATSRM